MAKVAPDRRGIPFAHLRSTLLKIPEICLNRLHSVAHFAKYRDGLSITPQATSHPLTQREKTHPVNRVFLPVTRTGP